MRPNSLMNLALAATLIAGGTACERISSTSRQESDAGIERGLYYVPENLNEAVREGMQPQPDEGQPSTQPPKLDFVPNHTGELISGPSPNVEAAIGSAALRK